ncbi:MAG: acyl-CoA desaturase, partial [Gammaproteobacteria bacterium]|nr:acyl-CoA desaturase [Gammaproteobacteria bacterium]
KQQSLQQIWGRTSSNGHEMVQALKDWCAQAEATRIRVLEDFAAHLRTYSLQPNSA